VPYSVAKSCMNFLRRRAGYYVCGGIFLGLLWVILAAHLNSREGRQWNLRFLWVLRGQRTEFYFRDSNFNQPVLGGRFLWKIQAKHPSLAKFGWGRHFVSRRTLLEDSDKLCIVMGVDGSFPEYDDVGGMLLVGSERIPLQLGKQSAMDKKKHMLFWKTPPLKTFPPRGTFAITNARSGGTLFTYRF
jgi:hypothetical protein